MASSRRATKKSLRTDFDPSARLRLIRAAHQARRATKFPSLLFGVAVERPVFIVGAPRSGTSLLYTILRRSSQLRHWPGESHEIWEADVHPAARGWESNVLGPDEAAPDVAARIRRSFFLVTGKKHRLVDKTPRNALRVPFVDAIFPDATYVYL
ncbi:MAG: sulfotransferase, partial [Actinomycetota bacterium]|nr:sulfotransferase [Actinomycetota bacterium]